MNVNFNQAPFCEKKNFQKILRDRPLYILDFKNLFEIFVLDLKQLTHLVRILSQVLGRCQTKIN